jgi:hypothetical protein
MFITPQIIPKFMMSRLEADNKLKSSKTSCLSLFINWCDCHIMNALW